MQKNYLYQVGNGMTYFTEAQVRPGCGLSNLFSSIDKQAAIDRAKTADSNLLQVAKKKKKKIGKQRQHHHEKHKKKKCTRHRDIFT